MADSPLHPALQRIVASNDASQAFRLLCDTLSGTELTTLMLGVAAARADRVTTAEVLRQHQRDRFVGPSAVDALSLARIELHALETATPTFEPVALAPLAPLGTHRALGATPQNNVVTTMRQSEVTADPTNSLALEAAVRRRELLAEHPKSPQSVDLAAVHRVTRAQHFAGPRSFAHFALFGLVSAGRDQGGFDFELGRLGTQIRVLIALVRKITLAPIAVQISPFRPQLVDGAQVLCASLASHSVSCELWPDRDHGREYYRSICFKLNMDLHGDRYELGDGGDVWWTQELLQNRKERLVIAGLGLDRLALLLQEEADLGP